MSTVTPTSTLPASMLDDAADAAARYGTPLFFYSIGRLQAQIARMRACLSGHPTRLLFATMANDRPAIQRAIAAAGVGACVNSMPHLERALEHGFALDGIQFTSCGLPVADMTCLQALGVPANLDSPTQVAAWCRLKTGAVAGARINAACLTGSPAPPDRIGMSRDDLTRARAVAREHGGRINGLHVYAGTNFQAAREILPILRGLFALVRELPDIDYVNIGGGIGVDYAHDGEPFDYALFGREVCGMARQVSEERGRPLAVVIEPGRSLVAACGIFVTRVTDIKQLHDTRYVVVDASVALFPRPFHHPGSLHRAHVLGRSASSETVPSTVVGRTTFSRDILGVYALPADLTVGSAIALEDAGAYCESMTSRFLGQRDPVCYVSEV